MAAYWGIAAHSAYDMFSWYKYLKKNPTPQFVEWEFLSDCAISCSLPTFTFPCIFARGVIQKFVDKCNKIYEMHKISKILRVNILISP